MQEMQGQSLGGELVSILVRICLYYTGGGNGNPLQYSCLGNLKDRGAWWATVHGVTKESDTNQWLNNNNNNNNNNNIIFNTQKLKRFSSIIRNKMRMPITSVFIQHSTGSPSRVSREKRKKRHSNQNWYHCSVPKSHPTLGHPWDFNTPGFPILHYLPKFAQTHVQKVGDDIQPAHLLLPRSPLALNLPQHQGLFQWVGSLHQVA